MIWGYPHFKKPPYMFSFEVGWAGSLGELPEGAVWIPEPLADAQVVSSGSLSWVMIEIQMPSHVLRLWHTYGYLEVSWNRGSRVALVIIHFWVPHGAPIYYGNPHFPTLSYTLLQKSPHPSFGRPDVTRHTGKTCRPMAPWLFWSHEMKRRSITVKAISNWVSGSHQGV